MKVSRVVKVTIHAVLIQEMQGSEKYVRFEASVAVFRDVTQRG
jgi:hypothetical protein